METVRKAGRWSRLAALLSLASIYFSPVTAQTLDSIKQTARKKFPTVPQISPAELAAWLNDTNRAFPMLFDAREEDEFQVSHIRGAVNVHSVAEAKRAVRSLSQPIVTYCSVGYRSSSLAEKLQRAGFTSVTNLEGSIFQWANEGHPVFRGTNRADKVHPYNRKWGQLLKPDLRANP